MKRLLKWGLGIPGVLALAAALVAWDANRRAWRAFEAHEERVAGLAAGLRARHKAAPVHVPNPRGVTALSFRRVNERVQMRESGVFFPYEEGWAANSYLSFFLYQYRADLLSQPSEGSLLKQLGAAHDLCRGGDPEAVHTQLQLESEALMSWREALEAHTLSAREARDMLAGLDALLASRPRIEDAVLAIHLIHCGSIIRVLRKREDPVDYVQKDPEARSFYSWKILLVQMLNERADEYRSVTALRADTWRERFEAALAVEKDLHPRRNPPIAPWVDASAAALIRDDALVRDRWILARTATAIAGYQAEHGRSPGSLQELVPAWLPELPRSPYIGSPLEYGNGCLRSPASRDSETDPAWTVKRR